MLDALFGNWDDGSVKIIRKALTQSSLPLNFLKLLSSLNVHSILRGKEGAVKWLEGQLSLLDSGCLDCSLTLRSQAFLFYRETFVLDTRYTQESITLVRSKAVKFKTSFAS